MGNDSVRENFRETGVVHYNPVANVAFCTESSPQSGQALSLFAEGTKLFELGNIIGAYEHFTVAQRLLPSLGGAFYARAVCLVRQGLFDSAIEMLHHELQAPHPHPNTLTLLQDIQAWPNKQSASESLQLRENEGCPVTIFAMPKAFVGHIDIIQRNAIKSWTMLKPRPEIILFGNEKGTAEIAHELGLRHIPQIKCNEHSTPMVDDLFLRGQNAATCPIVAYINADILLMSDFLSAIHQASGQFASFFMIGRRWDLDVSSLIDFSDPGWEKRFRDHIFSAGKLHEATGIDYFVFTRGLWQSIPPFAIGRTSWDNWFVYQALKQESPVIDATEAVFIIHQNHGYEHVRGGEHETWNGAEAQRNLALLGGYENVRTVEHATWKLTKSGIEKSVLLQAKMPVNQHEPATTAKSSSVSVSQAIPAAASRKTDRPLRLMQVETFYPHMFNFMYGNDMQLSQRPFAEQTKAILDYGLNAVHILTPFMQPMGYEVQFIAANCMPSQVKWAQENGFLFSSRSNWVHEIVRAQVEAYKPDILYTTDPVTFDARFIGSLAWRPALVAAWHASDIPPTTDWSGIDVIVSPLTALRKTALKLGARAAEEFMPGFPVWIYDHIKDVRPQYDIVFCGQWTEGQHEKRNRYLRQLSRAAAQGSPPFSCAFYLSGQTATICPEVAGFNMGERYGIAMHRALRSGRMALDARGSIRSLDGSNESGQAAQDIAGSETANMRIFEATGSGVLLLTELHQNLSQFFEIGKEVETFRDERELLDKVAYYTLHEEERKAIAQAGHQRCLRDHCMQNRAKDFDRIIRKHLSIKKPDILEAGELRTPRTGNTDVGHTVLRQAHHSALISEQSKYDTLVHQANRFIDLGDLTSAERSLSQALRLEANDPRLLVAYGGILHQLDDLQTSLRELVKATVLFPQYGPAHAKLASLLVTLNRPRQAEQTARRALSLDPADSEAIDVLFQVSDFEEARQAFLGSVIRTPKPFPPVRSQTIHQGANDGKVFDM